jgi:paraquat-inducible protein B
LSGAYIEVAPGIGAARQSLTFTGLEQEPVTAVGTPGKRIRFVRATSGSVGVGDPLLYRGFRVGRVEESHLDLENREVRYTAFITDPYDQLVTTNTRFWNVSGISAELSAEGFKLGIASFQTLLAGGVAFGPGKGSVPGDPVPNDYVFELFHDEASAYENPHRFYRDYVVSFMEPMGGLKPGAPVTFRGIRIGTVQRILISESFEASAPGVNRPVPVLVRIQPGRMTDDTQQSMDRMNEAIDRSVQNGLRATLATGNLLTGSQLINLDYVEGAPPATVGEYQGYPTVPTISSGLARLTDQVSDLLAKVNALPLEETVSTANETIAELQHTLQDVRSLLASDGIQNLPARLDAALLQLNHALANFSEESGFSERLARLMLEATTTLKSVQDVAESLEQNPNSLIFPTRQPPDPQPKASSR